MDHLCYVLCLSCFRICSLLPCCHLLGKGWPTSWLLFVMSNCDFVTFTCGILGQVWYLIVLILIFARFLTLYRNYYSRFLSWYLIVLIPDLCRLSYFVESQNIKGLSVCRYDSSLLISLLAAYAQNIMPANWAHIPTPEMASMWPNLEPIADHLMEWNPCQIGLLIGYNCPRCSIPREVMAPVKDGPFGQKLTWNGEFWE